MKIKKEKVESVINGLIEAIELRPYSCSTSVAIAEFESKHGGKCQVLIKVTKDEEELFDQVSGEWACEDKK